MLSLVEIVILVGSQNQQYNEHIYSIV